MDGAELRVDLKTDLAPGREWSVVSVTLTDARGDVFEVSEDAQPSVDYLRGSRIALFERVAPGAATVRVELTTLVGTSVQFVRAQIDGATGITILVPRSCADIECDVALGVCRNAQCVSTECSPENLEACPDPDCAADAECATAACAIGRCVEGVCLAEDRGTCDCDPSFGCGALGFDASLIAVGSESLLGRLEPSGEGARVAWAISETAPEGDLVAWVDDATTMETFGGGSLSVPGLRPATTYVLAAYAFRDGVDGEREVSEAWSAEAVTDPAEIETEYPTAIGVVPTLVLPPAARTEALAPIVLFLHGWGARNTVAGADLATFRDQDGVRTLVERGDPAFADFPFLLVAPRCNDTQMDCWRWSPSDAILDLVDMAAAENGGDPTRLYVTGLSTGGGGTWRMLAEHPDRVRAAVPIATVEVPELETALGMPSCAATGVSTWAFHSMNDTLQLPANSEALVTAHVSCEPEVQLSIGDWVNGGNDHTGWVEVYTNAHGFTFDGTSSIWTWFLTR